MGMTWQTTDAQKEREAYIRELETREHDIAHLARSFGIGRKTACKWRERFLEGGLAERSRAPRRHPNALGAEMVALILELENRWRTWGAPKLRGKLRAQVGAEPCPSESSISRILHRHGLVRPPGRRRRVAYGTPLQDCGESNAIRCADFKGCFNLGDGVVCTPLTISDGHSRYLLCCQGLTEGTGQVVVKPVFEMLTRMSYPCAGTYLLAVIPLGYRGGA
jgi:putative transposase